MEKVLLAWSGGKDSAMALYEMGMGQGYEIAALLTTITEDYGRISMHGVRAELLERQAESLRLPLARVLLTKDSTNEEYEARMEATLREYADRGVTSVVFGDIFLEDLREYREKNLARLDMKALFPLWKRDTGELARDFIALGFRAVVTCVDTSVLDGAFSGRVYDERFISDLPDAVDPCGENGEFHSFVYDGPIFREPIAHRKGEVVLRESRFSYCDLLPV